MPIKVIASILIKAGEEHSFIDAAGRCARISRDEGGVLSFDVWRAADERTYLFSELFVDEAAMRKHVSSEHVQAFGAVARDLMESRPSIVVCHPIDVMV